MISAISPWAIAAELVLPSTTEAIEDSAREGSIELPTGQYGQLSKPSESVSGAIERRAWVIPQTKSALELTNQLVTQLQREGYKVHWHCAGDACGGFDFRYSIETSPPPDFQVNLNDFYYYDLRAPNGNIETLLASDVSGDIHLQNISIVPSEIELVPDTDVNNGVDTGAAAAIAVEKPTEAKPQDTAQQAGNQDARWVLRSVTFDQGQSTPSGYDNDELERIAERLDQEPQLTVYIVGHSDQSGSLAGNLSITRARANAVRGILVNEFSVDPNRILADGVGFLAPIADNDTDAGRAKNRRVEAVFLTN